MMTKLAPGEKIVIYMTKDHPLLPLLLRIVKRKKQRESLKEVSNG